MNEFMFIPSLFIFVLLYLISFYMVLNLDDWFVVWLGMEVNMFSFILLIYKRNSMLVIESCFKYFFVQSLGSVMMMMFFYLNKSTFMYLGSIIMSYKMGAGPFYFWFPSVCSGIGWWANFVLMSIQKVIPLMLMMMFISWVVNIIIVMSLFIGGLGSVNQINLKRLMAYSSIHHSGWLLLCCMLDLSLWIFYLIIYSFILYPIFMEYKEMEVEVLNNMNLWNSKWWFVLGILSMGGMPPMLGFFLKWMVFYFMSQMNVLLIFCLLVMSVFMFYVYLRIIYDFIMGGGNKVSWLMKDQYYTMYNIDLLSVIGPWMGMIFVMILLY